MNIQIAQTLFSFIDSATKSQMTNMNTVMSVIGIVVSGFWNIYILMKALYWYFEGLTVVIKDVFFTIFKAFVILFMAFTVSWYTNTIIPVVTDFPVWLGNTIAGTGNEANNLVDGVVNSYITGFISLMESMKFGWSVASVKSIFIGGVSSLLYLLGGIPFLTIAVGTLITLKVATNLLLIIGPIFISLLLFPQTSQYFWGWVGTLGGFVLTQVFFVVVIGMEISFVNVNIIKDGTIETDLVGCFSILLYFVSFTLLATELPAYAAAIMSGAPSGGVGGVGGLLGKMTGAGTAGRMSRTLGNKLINRYHKRGKGRITT